jgi:chromosome segregation ATPase
MNITKIFSGMVFMSALLCLPVFAQTQGTDSSTQSSGAVPQVTDTTSADTLSKKSIDELRKDLAETNKQFSAIRKEALKDITVSELSDKWNKKLDSLMLAKDPTTKEKFTQRDKIAGDFEKARKENKKEDMQKAQLAYKDVMLDIQKIQQKVLEDDSLRAEYQGVEDAIMNKMAQLNPKAPELKKKIEDISAAIRSKQ